MLHSLHAKNFDHFSDIDLKFGRVNVLTGENGSGKTNLLKLLYVVLAWDSAAEPSLDTLKLLLASEFRTRQVSSLCDIRLRRATPLDSRGFSFWWEGYSWKAKVQADAPCTPENQAPVFRITDLESDAEFTFGRMEEQKPMAGGAMTDKCRCGWNGTGDHPCHNNGYSCGAPAKERWYSPPYLASLAGVQMKLSMHQTVACDKCWAVFSADLKAAREE